MASPKPKKGARAALLRMGFKQRPNRDMPEFKHVLGKGHLMAVQIGRTGQWSLVDERESPSLTVIPPVDEEAFLFGLTLRGMREIFPDPVPMSSYQRALRQLDFRRGNAARSNIDVWNKRLPHFTASLRVTLRPEGHFVSAYYHSGNKYVWSKGEEFKTVAEMKRAIQFLTKTYGRED